MPRRKEYPQEIELKVPNTVADTMGSGDGFNTDAQYEAAQVILEHWDGGDTVRFKDLPELGVEMGYPNRTRGHYQNVFYDYFGFPDGYNLTFRELFDEFESLAEYRKQREIESEKQQAVQETMQSIDGRDDVYSKAEMEAFQQGMRFMFELMQNNDQLPREFSEQRRR